MSAFGMDARWTWPRWTLPCHTCAEEMNSPLPCLCRNFTVWTSDFLSHVYLKNSVSSSMFQWLAKPDPHFHCKHAVSKLSGCLHLNTIQSVAMFEDAVTMEGANNPVDESRSSQRRRSVEGTTTMRSKEEETQLNLDADFLCVYRRAEAKNCSRKDTTQQLNLLYQVVGVCCCCSHTWNNTSCVRNYPQNRTKGTTVHSHNTRGRVNIKRSVDHLTVIRLTTTSFSSL